MCDLRPTFNSSLEKTSLFRFPRTHPFALDEGKASEEIVSDLLFSKET